MTWKPSEGAKRAGDVVCNLDRDAKANGWPIHYLMLVRMQDIIAMAIEQALEDGANRAGEPWGDFEHAGAFKPDAPKVPSPYVDTRQWWKDTATTQTAPYPLNDGLPPATADPIGMDPEGLAKIHAEAEAVMTRMDEPLEQDVDGPVVDKWADHPVAPKKRRKGKKGKAAKIMAKRAKKLAPALQALADGPVAETVAPTVEVPGE